MAVLGKYQYAKVSEHRSQKNCGAFLAVSGKCFYNFYEFSFATTSRLE